MKPRAFNLSSLVAEAAELFGASVAKIEYKVGEKYVVRAGLDCLVCSSQDAKRPWKPYTTKKKAFGRLVGVDGDLLMIMIEHKWLLMIDHHRVMTEDEDFVRMRKERNQEEENG